MLKRCVETTLNRIGDPVQPWKTPTPNRNHGVCWDRDRNRDRNRDRDGDRDGDRDMDRQRDTTGAWMLSFGTSSPIVCKATENSSVPTSPRPATSSSERARVQQSMYKCACDIEHVPSRLHILHDTVLVSRWHGIRVSHSMQASYPPPSVSGRGPSPLH